MGTWNLDPSDLKLDLNWDDEDTPVIEVVSQRPIRPGLECYFHGYGSQAVERLEWGHPICQRCVDYGVPR